MTNSVTFSFGENWLNYLTVLNEKRFQAARQSLVDLLGLADLTNHTFLDIGCGSGLFSGAAVVLNAQTVTSVDVDLQSVTACRQLKAQLGEPPQWSVLHGSILEQSLLAELSKSDIVYSWGVLHHTGAMWQAIENAATLVNDDGLLAIAIYNRHWSSGFWLWFKQRYNRSGKWGKRLLVWSLFAPRVAVRTLKGKAPLEGPRGMSIYYDAIDWAGGLPYEYASVEEIVRFCSAQGFVLQNTICTKSTGCNQFVFRKQA